MSIIDLLKKLFPFLVSAAERTFNNLEDAAKEAGINGSLFAQIIKENSEAASDDVKNIIKSKLGFSDAQLNDLLEALRQEYNIPTEDHIIEFLQMKVNNVTSGILHNSVVNEIFTVAALALSKGKLTWLTLLMGVGEYIYRKFVKGVDVAVITGGGDTPKCPPHYVWNGSQCVPDIG